MLNKFGTIDIMIPANIKQTGIVKILLLSFNMIFDSIIVIGIVNLIRIDCMLPLVLSNPDEYTINIPFNASNMPINIKSPKYLLM